MIQLVGNKRESDRQPSVLRRWLFASRLATVLPSVGLIAAVAFAGGAFSRPPVPSESGKATMPMDVAIDRARSQNGYTVSREFVGRIEARRESRVSLELDGLVLEVAFDEGDAVRKGEVIARLDSQILQSQRDAMEARVAAAQSQLDELVAGPRQEVIEAARAEVQHWSARVQLAGLTRDRQQRLVEKDSGSLQELENATYGEQSSTAQWQAAKARLRELESGTRGERVATQRATVSQLRAELATIDVQLGKTFLYAPYSGIVSERFVDEGTVIESGTPILQLLETDRLDVRVGLSEEIVDRLQSGAEQEVFIDGESVIATVRSIRPDRNQKTRTVSVLLELDRQESSVHIGDLATVRVSTHVTEPGFWVPTTALTEGYRGLWGCFVTVPLAETGLSSPVKFGAALSANNTHRLELRELEIIHQSDTAAYVRGSLSDGESYVTSGLQRLVADQHVRPLVITEPTAESIAKLR